MSARAWERRRERARHNAKRGWRWEQERIPSRQQRARLADLQRKRRAWAAAQAMALDPGGCCMEGRRGWQEAARHNLPGNRRNRVP